MSESAYDAESTLVNLLDSAVERGATFAPPGGDIAFDASAERFEVMK